MRFLRWPGFHIHGYNLMATSRVWCSLASRKWEPAASWVQAWPSPHTHSNCYPARVVLLPRNAQEFGFCFLVKVKVLFSFFYLFLSPVNMDFLKLNKSKYYVLVKLFLWVPRCYKLIDRYHSWACRLHITSSIENMLLFIWVLLVVTNRSHIHGFTVS